MLVLVAHCDKCDKVRDLTQDEAMKDDTRCECGGKLLAEEAKQK